MSIIKIIIILQAAMSVASFAVHESKFRLGVKNPEVNYTYIKRRIQKAVRGYRKALDKIKLNHDNELKALEKMTKLSHYSLFGYKLSRMPGDGGAINKFVRGGNNKAIIAAYYTGTYNPNIYNMHSYKNPHKTIKYDKESLTCKPYDIFSFNPTKKITIEQIEVINAYPDTTFGVHQGKEPAKAETFAEDFTPPASPDEYRFYALGKMPELSKTPRGKAKISPVVIREQGYSGLITDTLFGHIDDPDVDFLRKIEIFLKHRNAEEKPPEKKTYWLRTYNWNIPDEISSLVEAESNIEEEEDPFLPKIPKQDTGFSFNSEEF